MAGDEEFHLLQPVALAFGLVERVQRHHEGAAGHRQSLHGIRDGAVLSVLNSVVHRLQQLADVDPALRDVLAALEPAQVQVEEAAHSLTRYVDRLELDPERLQAVEARMQALHTAARKYRLPPEQLPDELLARRRQLDDLQSAQDINKVLAREAAARAAYLTLARRPRGPAPC